MDAKRTQEVIEAFVNTALKKTISGTISLSSEGKNWKAMVELIEEKGYIDDVLGAYEFTLDEQLTVLSYRRVGLRRRSDTSPKDWEKPSLELLAEE
jgi:hypothetical protein